VVHIKNRLVSACRYRRITIDDLIWPVSMLTFVEFCAHEAGGKATKALLKQQGFR